MIKLLPISILGIVALMFFSSRLLAQTEVTMQVKKDGKVIKDTTYHFENDSDAKHAVKMMDIKSHSKAMVFISEDGELTEIKEFHGDSLVWVSEGEHPHGEHVKVMKYKMEGGEQKKTVKVMVVGDENGNWHAKEGVDEDHMEIETNVYVIKGDDDLKVEMKKIMEEHDGAEGSYVKMIIIKESKDHDADHDEDVDVDHDEDEDHDVEVEVVKKKRNKK